MCLRSRCEHSHISTCTCAKHCFNEFYYTIFRVDLLFCGYCWTTDHFNNIHITSYYQIWSDLLNSVESICPVYPDLRSVSFVANEKRWTTLIQSREGSHASGIPMKYAQLSFFHGLPHVLSLFTYTVEFFIFACYHTENRSHRKSIFRTNGHSTNRTRRQGIFRIFCVYSLFTNA